MAGGRGAPAFGRIQGAGKSSMRARDDQGGNGGRGKRLLNRGMTNGNYIGKRSETGAAEEGRAKEDNHVLHAALGFGLFTDGPDRLGWLINMQGAERDDKDSGQVASVVNCFFQCQDGSMFKAQVDFSPYFYLQVKDDLEMEVDAWLRRKFARSLRDVEVVEREDLDLKNHLSGIKRRLLKVTFWNSDQLAQVRREVQPLVNRNRHRRDGTGAYAAQGAGAGGSKAGRERLQEAADSIVDMREHDVPYHVRFAIDTDVRAGHWYTVKAQGGRVTLEQRPDLLQRAEVRICAFDIETTKLPLQFPSAEYDQVFMISYMLDRQGYLIINREVVSEDVRDFEYTPKPEFEGPFRVFNCANEAACLRCWFDHMRTVQPAVYVTYNGDYFDWPFIETRAAKHGMDMGQEIGFVCDRVAGQCLSPAAVHMDCLAWVNRDSYLPQGSRGLKAVTKYKLGYDPVEVDPEDMVRLAAERPQDMASYSVSDAVSTYYLYMTYIHPFVFSLSTIIPMPPDEVLRKGSGTLCEALLMVEAARAGIVAPNKHAASSERMFRGHLLESETYIGGKVEALEAGIFRADLPCRFRCNPEAYQRLLDRLDHDLAYALKADAKWGVEEVANYAEVREQVAAALTDLRDRPVREEPPLIYHLDVAAMYPNIILTNRLQPSAIVTDEDCAACDFNRPGKTCLREMEWVWRGETYTASRAEYYSIKSQLQSEAFPAAAPGGAQRTWGDLPFDERSRLLKDRLKRYCQRVYKRVLDKPVSEARMAGVCQRENSFYYDTVQAFRDRRYEYKALNKEWKGKLDAARGPGGSAVRAAEAADMCVVYDSLQLAHKCILNSFYGYVMRKGARWYSMEMAGVVTHTGANIIKRANELVKQVGRPLELDTDGIWCALPATFPEEFKLVHATSGKVFKLSYPCAMLNVQLADHNTNDQFTTLGPDGRYTTSSEMTIEFEVDGPYQAMILPASKEEGKLIKKRYAVFNPDGSLAEIKGFELKRRGELKLIKVFQGEVFDSTSNPFLSGSTLEECYAAVGAVANRWLDLLDTRGVDVTDEELVDLISEMTVMSKGLEDYGGRKSCAITCATRLAAFLGDERIRDKGLVCHYVVAAHPQGTPTSERAIPVAIFSTEPSVARTYLRRWCGGNVGRGDPSSVPDVRDVVDWAYYKERLGNAIQKIITIPAAMQRVPNPVPRVRHPDWLHKRVAEKEDTHKQTKVDVLFAAARGKAPAAGPAAVPDLEDFGGSAPRRSPLGGATAAAVGLASSVQVTPAAVRRVAEGAGPSGSDENTAANLQQQQQQQQQAGAGGEAPDRAASYAAWLAAKKELWRRTRAERKRQREGPGGGEGRRQRQRLGAAPATGVEGMFAQQAEAAAGAPWQLVSIAPTPELGVYKAWTVINGRMHAIPLRIPRTLYVDSSLPPDHPTAAGLGSLVRRTLPGAAEAQFTYQITLPEGHYKRDLPRLEEVLSGPGMRRVYEAQVPPEWNAALAAGCVAVVAPGARRRNLGAGFELSELAMRPVVQHDYFSAPGALKHMTLHHSADAGRGRALYALHLPADATCHVWLVNPARGAQREVTAAAAERVWQESGPGDNDEAEGTPRFEVAYVRSADAAVKALQKMLARIKDRARGPTVLLLNSPDVEHLHHSLPALTHLPCAAMPAPPDDSAYPALGWQLPATRAAARRLQAAPEWLAARLQAARYAHLPLSSIGADWVLDTCDALFARQLRDAGHLLWAADPSQPDVAGRPCDVAEALVLREGQARPEVAWPGTYRCVCVEVRVSHLAVCAVLEAATLGDLEGSALVDDQAGCGAAFRVLRNLAQSWIDDATRRNNICADTLLRHMYRWLCSPSARLHDPALKAAVQALARKLLLQLVAELKRLGATVVWADTSSLILATGKHGLAAALGYVDYVLDTLRRRELFQWLSLSPSRCWHTLLFADRYNYLGVVAPLPASLAASMSQAPGSLAQGPALREAGDELVVGAATLAAPQFDCVLNMRDYLPPALHDAFTSAVAEFVWLPWREAVRAALAEAAAAAEAAGEGEGVGETEGGAASELAGLGAAQESWLAQSLPGPFTDRLLRGVKHAALHVAAHDGRPEHQFPLLAGSHLGPGQLGTPALALVRAVCHLYSLDGAQRDAVTVLRRQLLRLIHVKEFGGEAAWVDPCMTLVLPDVVCSGCQECVDLDMCRDPRIQARDWRCGFCGTQRDVAAVEARLVSQLRALGEAYQVQDLRCGKCMTVATNHLQRQCDMCGGHVGPTQPAARALAAVAVYRNVATFHGMEVLEEVAGRELGEQQA